MALGRGAVIPEPVQMALEDHPDLSRHLERSLMAERAKQIEGFTSAKDWADFQKRRGIVEGIDIALSCCSAARKLLEG